MARGEVWLSSKTHFKESSSHSKGDMEWPISCANTSRFSPPKEVSDKDWTRTSSQVIDRKTSSNSVFFPPERHPWERMPYTDEKHPVENRYRDDLDSGWKPRYMWINRPDSALKRTGTGERRLIKANPAKLSVAVSKRVNIWLNKRTAFTDAPRL